MLRGRRIAACWRGRSRRAGRRRPGSTACATACRAARPSAAPGPRAAAPSWRDRSTCFARSALAWRTRSSDSFLASAFSRLWSSSSFEESCCAGLEHRRLGRQQALLLEALEIGQPLLAGEQLLPRRRRSRSAASRVSIGARQQETPSAHRQSQREPGPSAASISSHVRLLTSRLDATRTKRERKDFAAAGGGAPAGRPAESAALARFAAPTQG